MTDIDSTKFRQVLGHFPTGVTVIAATKSDGNPAGFSVGSFASVSLEPPLVMFCAGKSSQSWPEIQETGHFSVNVLSDAQSELSNTFAAKDIDKFAGLKWGTQKTGAPIFDDALCWIDCEIESIHDAGDHWIVVGLVQDLGVNEKVAGAGGPLIFYSGAYSKIQPI